MKRHLFITALCLWGSLALAIKDRGGGNVAADGSLLDLQYNNGVTELQKVDVDRLLMNEFSAKVSAPLVAVSTYILQGYGTDQMTWLVDSRAFNEDGCQYKGVVGLAGHTVACQTKTGVGFAEVRISASYWQSATISQRAQLLLHERLRNILFTRQIDCESCLFEATAAFVQPATAGDAYVRNLRDVLARSGFGTYFLAGEIQLIVADLKKQLAPACAGPAAQFSDALNVVRDHPAYNLPAPLPQAEFKVLDTIASIYGGSVCAKIDSAVTGSLNVMQGLQLQQ